MFSEEVYDLLLLYCSLFFSGAFLTAVAQVLDPPLILDHHGIYVKSVHGQNTDLCCKVL